MNKIKFYEDHDWYYMDFLNGSTRISKTAGAYCIASGCGSGKTTIIYQVAKIKFNEGVLLVFKTTEECNRAYDELKTLINYSDSLKQDSQVLHPDEIINLCSEPRIEAVRQADGSINHICTNGVNLNWKNDFSLIYKAKIVIATHYVLMNTCIDHLTRFEPSKYAQIYQGNVPLEVKEIKLDEGQNTPDRIYSGMNGVETCFRIRQFIMIDELPSAKPLQIAGNMSMFYVFAMRNERFRRNQDPKIGFNMSHYHSMKSRYPEFLKLYHYLETMDPKVYRLPGFTDNKLGEDRRSMLLSAIYAGLPAELDRIEDESVYAMEHPEENTRVNPEVTIKYNIPLLVFRGTSSNLWLFEGTGDITMKNSPYFNLGMGPITYPDKYKGESVDIFRIPSYLKSRSVEVDKMFSKKTDVLKELDKVIDQVKEIIKVNQETLVITWKYLRPKFVTSDDADTKELIAKFTLNDEFNLPAYIENRLLELNDRTGELNGHKFHIIHYGSGKDLATNEFRNCDSIVRLGSYIIPGYALDDINTDIGSRMDMKDFVLYQNVQALSRTHIRKHEGKRVRLYMSDDFNESHFYNLEQYLNNEGCSVRSFESVIAKKLDGKVKELSKYLPQVNYCLYTREDIYLSMSLDEMYKIIPVYDKKVSTYTPLLTELDKIGLHITLTTNSNNKGKK